MAEATTAPPATGNTSAGAGAAAPAAAAPPAAPPPAAAGAAAPPAAPAGAAGAKDTGDGGILGGTEPGAGAAGKAPDGTPGGEFKLTVPEGVAIDGKLIEQATGLFKEMGLKQEQAQKLVDLQVASVKAYSEKADAAWKATDKEWVQTLQKDPEVGGAKYLDTVANARRAILALGGEELRKEIAFYGIGNMPGLVKAFAKIGVQIGEDSARAGQGGGGGPAPKPATLPEKLAVVYDSPDMKRVGGKQ